MITGVVGSSTESALFFFIFKTPTQFTKTTHVKTRTLAISVSELHRLQLSFFKAEIGVRVFKKWFSKKNGDREREIESAF